MKPALISIPLYALLCAALPQDTESYLREQCSSNELSCCSNLKSTAEANGNTIDQNQGNQVLDVASGVGVLVSVLTGNTLNQVANIIPIRILSGCAPIIGTYNSATLEISLDAHAAFLVMIVMVIMTVGKTEK